MNAREKFLKNTAIVKAMIDKISDEEASALADILDVVNDMIEGNKPAMPIEGLERYTIISPNAPYGEYVRFDQAEAIIAAERSAKEEAENGCLAAALIIKELRAENAALTARVKGREQERDEYCDKWKSIMEEEKSNRKTYLLHTEYLESQLAATGSQQAAIDLVLVRTASDTPVPSHGGPAVSITWKLSLNGVVIESCHERYHWSDRDKAGLKAPSHMQKLLVDLQAAIDSPPLQQEMADEQE